MKGSMCIETQSWSEKNQLLLDGSGGAAVLAYKEHLRFQVWCFMVRALPTFVVSKSPSIECYCGRNTLYFL